MTIDRACSFFVLVPAALLLGCERSDAPPPAATAPPEPAAAVAPATPEPIEIAIESRSGSKLTGTATFREESGGVRVVLEVANAPPGPRGAHVHEQGDCSAADASSAGDHFNPGGDPHARPPERPRHLGDLGNVEIGPDGRGTLEILVEGANLRPGDAHSFLDRAVIVHGQADDGGQPSGNAGSRIGCGVIRR